MFYMLRQVTVLNNLRHLSQMRELTDRGLPPVQSHSIMGSGSRPIVAATDYLGVSNSPQGVHLSNPVDPVFRLSTAPVS